MSNLLKYIRFLSLDIALGGALLSISISEFMGIEMPISIPICLAISIWVIYTADHLLDARKQKEPTIDRHLFHRRNFKTLTINAFIVLLAGFYIVLSLPAITFIYGLGLLLLVLIYFTLIYFFKGFYLKEILVALVYSFGVFLGPISLSGGQISAQATTFFIQLLLLAFTNLILFSFYEAEEDTRDNNPSIVLKLGLDRINQLFKILFFTLLSIQVYSVIFFSTGANSLIFQVLFMLMTTILFILKYWEAYFRQNDRYRLIGDGIFFIPVIWLLI